MGTHRTSNLIDPHVAEANGIQFISFLEQFIAIVRLRNDSIEAAFGIEFCIVVVTFSQDSKLKRDSPTISRADCSNRIWVRTEMQKLTAYNLSAFSSSSLPLSG
jgi:hypothetical protein